MSDSNDENVTVKIRLYPEDGEEKGVAQLGFGVQPFILFSAGFDEETEEVTLEITGSLINDFDDLLEMIEGYSEALRGAIEQHRANAEVKE